MATSNIGEKKPTSATQETIKDIKTQVGDTFDAAKKAATTEQQPATSGATGTTEPQVGGNQGGAAQATTQQTESKIHRMNEKIKNFFRKLNPRKETTGTE